MLREKDYLHYAEILDKELTPAMGCTEPIAIAYAAAKAKEILGAEPETCEITVSGSIIKNAKSVVVPHTGGMRGIEAAAIAGIVAGRAEERLEVLSFVCEDDVEKMKLFSQAHSVTVRLSDGRDHFEIGVKLSKDEESSFVRILGRHTNVVRVEKNGKALLDRDASEGDRAESKADPLSIEAIVEFADGVDVSLVKDTLDRQIEYNMAIAEEGLRGNWGANIGSVYLKRYENDVSNKAKAYAAAGSDARMSGCEMPVIINSGSGNQGITASVPVIVYWQEMKLEREALYRALCVSNLVSIHVKRGIGTLSAYCGAVVAGAGAGCGIAYLHGGKFKDIAHTLVNTLAIDSGMICDGAKASCAAKIATAVENGILGFNLYREGNQFLGGDGIVKKGVENTIESVRRLARDGMKETDNEILKIMLG